MKKIGFIGVGIMGKSMVKNLMKARFELHIYARTKSKVNDVIEEGAIFHETIGECVRASEAVITMVGFPQDVEEVYFDEGNIMDQAEKGMYLIDMTTTSPMISKKIYEEGKKKGVHVVDAPVTGGDWKEKRKDSELKFSIPRMKNKKEIADDDMVSVRDILAATSGNKTDFMCSVIMKDYVKKMLPDYIERGLEWLMK